MNISGDVRFGYPDLAGRHFHINAVAGNLRDPNHHIRPGNNPLDDSGGLAFIFQTSLRLSYRECSLIDLLEWNYNYGLNKYQ